MDCFFTRKEILQDLSEKIRPLLEKETTFVDFSCGNNDFVGLLGCKSISFDINPIQGAITRDWLTVRDLPLDVVIGLNPPFGYQGQMARRFVEHALHFSPRYMALILPNLRWNPPGYEEIFSMELPKDAFYDPETGKIYREICANFKIYRPSTSIHKVPKPKEINRLEGVTLTRKFQPDRYPAVIVRRVGRNAIKQFYCLSSKEECLYIEKGKVFPGVTWAETKHSVESDYFLKIYFDQKKTMEELIQLCQYIFENPEPGYDRRQPHAVTNGYFWEVLGFWNKQSFIHIGRTSTK